MHAPNKWRIDIQLKNWSGAWQRNRQFHYFDYVGPETIRIVNLDDPSDLNALDSGVGVREFVILEPKMIFERV